MKHKIKTEEGIKYFNYCGIIAGEVLFTIDPKLIKRNRKAFGLTLDFETHNVRMSKREGFVIATYNATSHTPVMQFLVTDKSYYNHLEEEVKEFLTPAFDILNTDTLEDVLKLSHT